MFAAPYANAMSIITALKVFMYPTPVFSSVYNTPYCNIRSKKIKFVQ